MPMLERQSRTITGLLRVPCLFVNVQLPENLGGVKKMGVFNDPGGRLAAADAPKILRSSDFLAFQAMRGRLRMSGSQ